MIRGINDVEINKNLPVAVRDSGVGGISVLRELLRIMPEEDYLYFGDSANAPYGTKTKDEVLEITRKNLDILKERGIKSLVIACNTATSAAARRLRTENPDLPIIGIEPAVKPASMICENPRVLVMATPLTLREEKFLSLVDRFSDSAEFISLPCPSLVELIEAGETDSREIDDYLSRLFEPYKSLRIDAIVLGCTHYPHVKHIIKRHFPDQVKIIDGGEGTARQTKRRLQELSLLKTDGVGSVEILNSSPDPRLIEISEKLLYQDRNTSERSST